MPASIFAPNWLSRQPLEIALRRFASQQPVGAKVLDIGCGRKPYANLFEHTHYQGIDTDPAGGAYIIADSTAIPLPSVSADAIICTQTLQHVEDVAGTLVECSRLLKPGARIFLSVPFGIKIVDAVYYHDYWRFTKYGLATLLADWEVESIQETTGYFGTLAQLRNYFLASISQAAIMKPLFALNNITGFAGDALMKGIARGALGRRFYSNIYLSLTSNYIVIARPNPNLKRHS